MLRSIVVSLLVCTAPVALAGSEDVDKVNGSIDVDAGQQAGDLSTANGSIRVGDNATADEIETVNGSIRLGAQVTAHSLETVNGSILLEGGARVAKDAETVNGAVTLNKGAEVSGKVTNVNGHITLVEAHIGGGIETVNGGLDVGANSRVEGGIHVEKPHGISFGKPEIPRIVIGPGAVVQGTLKFDREVKLYVSDTARVGEIVGATPIKFSGDKAPE